MEKIYLYATVGVGAAKAAIWLVVWGMALMVLPLAYIVAPVLGITEWAGVWPTISGLAAGAIGSGMLWESISNRRKR